MFRGNSNSYKSNRLEYYIYLFTILFRCFRVVRISRCREKNTSDILVNEKTKKTLLQQSFLGACRRIPSLAREREFFRLAKTAKPGDVCSIVDTAGCGQTEKGQVEARSNLPTGC